MPTHDAALALLRDLAGRGSVWAIAWPSVYEFFSVVTSVKIWKHAASTPTEAWTQIVGLMAAPGLRMLSEPEGFASVLASFAKRARVRGPIIHDARIAAI